MAQTQGYKKASLLIVITVLSAFFINTIGGLVNPAIAALAGAYPDASLNTIMLVSTLPMLTAIPTNFLAGKIISKIGPKKSLIFGLLIYVLPNIVPAFLKVSFTPILVCRAITGIGAGILFPLTPMLVNAYIEPDRRSTILGYGQSVAQAMGIGLLALVGVVAARNVHNIWFLHVIMFVPLLLGLLLPKPPKWEADAPAEEEAASEQKKEKVPGAAWVIILLFFVWFVFSYPPFLYLSPLVEANGMGTAALSGFIQTIFTVGGVIAGLIFGKLYAATKKNLIPIGLLMLVLNYALFAFTKSVPLFFIGNLIGGIGYSLIYVGFITALSINTKPAVFPTAMGIMSALMNCGAFVSSYVISFIAKVAGQTASLTFPFVVCGAVFVVLSAILFIKPLKM